MEKLKPSATRPLSRETMRRIAAGIKKYLAPSWPRVMIKGKEYIVVDGVQIGPKEE